MEPFAFVSVCCLPYSIPAALLVVGPSILNARSLPSFVAVARGDVTMIAIGCSTITNVAAATTIVPTTFISPIVVIFGNSQTSGFEEPAFAIIAETWLIEHHVNAHCCPDANDSCQRLAYNPDGPCQREGLPLVARPLPGRPQPSIVDAVVATRPSSLH